MNASFLPGRVDRETEFAGGLMGACGPNAAAMAERWADQSRLTTLDVFQRMRAAGRCDANGVSNLDDLLADARAAGYRTDVLPYREPLAEADWRAFFTAHVGREAVVVELANGQALRDTLTGDGENAHNLHYHFLMVAGWHPGGFSQRAGRDLPTGWWCADGDNFVAGDVLEFYADGDLLAARPCAAMAVYARVSFSRGSSGSGGGVMIPAGWRDDGTTLTAPNGVAVVHGFRDYVLAHQNPAWRADDVPLHPEQEVASVVPQDGRHGAGTRQLFRFTGLVWTEREGVYELPCGEATDFLLGVLAADTAQIGALQGQVTALEAELNQLKQAQSGGAGGTPPPAPVPPAAADAVTAIAALANAMKALAAAHA